MLDLLLKLIRALLASLYTLFEGVPALDALRSWFGPEGSAGTRAAGLLLAALALLMGLVAFLVALWFLRRSPKARLRQFPLRVPTADLLRDKEADKGSAA